MGSFPIRTFCKWLPQRRSPEKDTRLWAGQDPNWHFVAISSWPCLSGVLRRHAKTIYDIIVNQAAGSLQRNYSVSPELLSFCARRRLSLGTTATRFDESDEGEDINKVDDHSDGDGVGPGHLHSLFNISVCRLFSNSLYGCLASPCLQFNVAAAVMQFLLDQHQTMT